MTRKLAGFTVITLTAIMAFSATPAVTIPITISDGIDSKTLYFGLDPIATDGIDASLGEMELPPLPPTGVFDARFVGADISIDIGLGSFKDYRTGDLTSVGARIHELQYQTGDGTAITISWSLPDAISGRLQDLATGTIINVPVRGTGNYVVTNPSVFSKLKLTVSYNLLKAGVKLHLQGPFNNSSGLMNNSLNTNGYLASRFPDAWIPAQAVDSICIEIRDSSFALKSTVRMFAPAWLLADGTIRGFSDTSVSFVEFETVKGDYYIVVRHRNHLAIMTANSRALSPSNSLYDFTTSQAQAYGTNPMKDLGGGKFGMYSGDGNGSGGVTISDRIIVWRAQSGFSGYLAGDYSLNGSVTVADMVTYWRANNGTSTQVP